MKNRAKASVEILADWNADIVCFSSGATKKVIILNGPPGSGKDTIADLMNYGLWVKMEVKQELIKTALAVSGVSKKEWTERYDNRKMKETGWDRLGGLSQREFLIKISEQWVKPVFGDDHYGILAGRGAKQLMEYGMNVVFSDGGFNAEVSAIADVVGAENMMIIHLHKSGCSFHGDSRDYVKVKDIATVTIDQDGLTPEESVERIKKELREQRGKEIGGL